MALSRLVSRLSRSARVLEVSTVTGKTVSSSAPNTLKKDAAELHSVATPPKIAMVARSRGERPVYDRPKGLSYTIHVVTGNLRGAGSESAVSVTLLGTRGNSQELEIGGTLGFNRGSVETVALPVSEDLGALKMIMVKRAQSGVSDTGAGWFLEKLMVDGPNGESWSFPCMQWFGVSDCGDITGPLERHLVPSEEDKPLAPQPVKVMASATTIPHPRKLREGMRGINKGSQGRGGEDSYFYTFGQNNIFGMGIADGVFATREQNIDSGIFSGTLMERAFEMVKRGYDDVVQVLKTVSRYVETEGVFGSSTCCILTINLSQGLLSSANLGDSGFMLIGSRPHRPEVHVVFRTSQQEHEFGWPFALGHHRYASKPCDAMMESLQILPGDTIVMGSDGLFDNVFVSEIVEEVVASRQEGRGPQALVQKLTEVAHTSSLKTEDETPYSRGYSEAFNLAMSGGKPDDITVLVAHIS